MSVLGLNYCNTVITIDRPLVVYEANAVPCLVSGLAQAYTKMAHAIVQQGLKYKEDENVLLMSDMMSFQSIAKKNDKNNSNWFQILHGILPAH